MSKKEYVLAEKDQLTEIAGAVREKFSAADSMSLSDIKKSITKTKQRVITIPAEEEKGTIIATGGGREITVDFDKEIYESVQVIVPDIEGVEYHLVQKNENGDIVWFGEEYDLADYINKKILVYMDETTEFSIRWECQLYVGKAGNNVYKKADLNFTYSGKGYIFSYLHKKGRYYFYIDDSEILNYWGEVYTDDFSEYVAFDVLEDIPDDVETLNDYSWAFLACKGRGDWVSQSLIGKSKDIYLNGKVGQRIFENYLVGVQLIDQWHYSTDRTDTVAFNNTTGRIVVNPGAKADGQEEGILLYENGLCFQIGVNNATENIPIALVEDVEYDYVFYYNEEELDEQHPQPGYYYSVWNDDGTEEVFLYDEEEDKFKALTNNRFIMVDPSFSYNYCGWKNSPVRTIILSQLFKALPRDLQKVISFTRKMSQAYNSVNARITEDYIYTEDKLIIPSVYELQGSSAWVMDPRTEELWQDIYKAYYKTDENGEREINTELLKRYKDTDVSSATSWWTRTPTGADGPRNYYYFCDVSENGSIQAKPGKEPAGIAPIFNL